MKHSHHQHPRHSGHDLSDTDLRAVLWSVRLKATSPRLIVLETLSKESKPLSVAILYKKTANKIDAATVYRTLSALVEAGIVKKLSLGGEAFSYELSFGRAHHHHAICTDCGTIEDIADCEPAELETVARKHTKGFSRITSHSLEFFGLCKKCA